MTKHEREVHIPANIAPYPEKYEVTAATILVRYFNANVHFVPRNNLKTADFLIRGVAWELKSPTGKGKRDIQHTLQAALSQSPNIIFDARRSKIHQNKMKAELQSQFSRTRKIKRLILITKIGTIVEFEK